MESNAGLSEARVSAVAVTASGAVVVARAADGASGGLWSARPGGGTAERLASSPPATVRALLASSGERLLAGTPDGLCARRRRRGRPFARVLGVPVLGLAAGAGRLFAATDAGRSSRATGALVGAASARSTTRVDAVIWSRSPGTRTETLAVPLVAGRTLWWNGRDFGPRGLPRPTRPAR